MPNTPDDLSINISHLLSGLSTYMLKKGINLAKGKAYISVHQSACMYHLILVYARSPRHRGYSRLSPQIDGLGKARYKHFDFVSISSLVRNSGRIEDGLAVSPSQMLICSLLLDCAGFVPPQPAYRLQVLAAVAPELVSNRWCAGSLGVDDVKVAEPVSGD